MHDRALVLMKAVMENLRGWILANVPETGRFQKHMNLFDNPLPHPNARELAMIVEPHPSEADKRCLRIAALHPEDDRMRSNFWFQGTNEELGAFLADSENIAPLLEAYRRLDEGVGTAD